jgi:hypothetical protein
VLIVDPQSAACAFERRILVRVFLMLFCLIGVVIRLRPPLFLHAFPHKLLVADHLADDSFGLGSSFLL